MRILKSYLLMMIMDHNSKPIPVQTLIPKTDSISECLFCFLEMYRNASFLQRTQLALRFRQLSVSDELNRRGYTGSKEGDSNVFSTIVRVQL